MKQQKKGLQRLAIACGGTGGHFYPGLSIARELHERAGEAMLILSGNNTITQRATAETFNINVICVKSSKLTSITCPLKLLVGIFQSIRELKKFRPDALLAMGSFASFTAAIAAKILGIPILLHDGNAKIGKSNRMLSYLANYLGIAFQPVNAEKCHCPYQIVGMPLRPELLSEWHKQLDKITAIKLINEQFGGSLSADKATLLIFGGSQGAATLNEVFPRVMKNLGRTNFQVIHLTGKDKFAATNDRYQDAEFEKLVLESSPEMALFYVAADAVICRSGGSTVAELLLFGKFAYLIPYPYAAELHQDDNARYMAAIGAAEIIYNGECTDRKVATTLNVWLNATVTFSARGLAGQKFAQPDAGKNMLELISDHAK